MRINKLELQAFGPFYKKEVILFSELYDSSIFLISGKTGSGKTTLFDAICFGLYGETSADRDVRSLKSDFSLELETYVIIEFELDGITYTIKRYPADQRITTERGSRNLKNQEVTLTYGSKTITGVTDVRNFVVDLLGVNAEQFKKIVMLPQGKFKELLFANTSEKGEIFRTIFGTERLSLIMNNIRNKYIEVKRKYEDTIRDKNMVLNNLECEDGKSVSEQIEEDTKFISDTEAIISKCSEQIILLRDEISKATETNKKIEDYNKAVAILEKLTSEKELIDNYNSELEKAVIAKENKKLHNSIISLSNDIKYTEKEISEKEIELETSIKKCDKIDISEDTIKLCRESINELNTKSLDLTKINDTFIKMQDARQKLDNKIVEQEKLYESLKLLVVSEEDRDNSRHRIRELEDKLTKLKNLTCKVKELKTVDNNLIISIEKCADLIIVNEQNSNKLLELQTLYNNELASQLAIELKHGKPCPVCGSLEHPNIATSDKKVATKQMIEQQQIKKEKSSIELTKYQTNRDNYISEKEKIEKEVKEFGIDFKSDADIEKFIFDTNNKLAEENDNQTKIEKSLNEKNEKGRLLTGLNSEIKVLEENFTKLCLEEKNTNKSQLSHNEVEEVLAKTLSDIADEKLKLDILEKTYKEKLAINESILKLNSHLNILRDNCRKYRDSLVVEQEEFNSILEKTFGNSVDNFIKYLSSDTNFLKNAIDRYKNELTECNTTISNLIEFKNKIIIDVAMQSKELLVKENEINDKKLKRDQVNNRNIINTKNIEAIDKLTLAISDLESKYSKLERINNVAQGNYNSEKINFETHVLAVFYEEVLVLTNNKLKQLSKGRYQLRRKAEKSGGGKQGLDTTIFDLTTGKERGINSVSGGESFMISLALALSLSEITQMNSNSVDIETIFIDEGFGTLDPESLEVTINLLLELNQDGKLIGIISHVKELQDRIAAKLLIEVSKNGSYIKDIIY